MTKEFLDTVIHVSENKYAIKAGKVKADKYLKKM